METSAKVGGLTVLAVLGLGLKLVGSVARASRHSTSSFSGSTYAGSSLYGGSASQRFGDFEARLERERAQRELDQTIREAKRELEDTVVRSCATTSPVRYLEPQGASLASLFRASRRLGAPGDVTVPLASTVMGLPVMVMAKDGVDVRWCADAVDGMARDLARNEPSWPASVVEKVAPGAWVIHTVPETGFPASTTLVSEKFLRALGPASLVAMAPTDHAVALADATKPEAIRAAARRLAPLVDTELGQGVMQAQPLLLKNGSWSEWKPAALPAEVAEVVRLGALAETRMALSLLEHFPHLDELEVWNQLGAGLPPLDLREGTITTLRTAAKRTTVVADASLEEALFVGEADSVEYSDGRTTRTLSWKDFTRQFAAQLEPVKVDGHTVPRVLRLVPPISR